MEWLAIIVIVLVVFLLLACIIRWWTYNPCLAYCPITVYVDISGKQSKSDEDYIDLAIIQNKDILKKHKNQYAAYVHYITKLKEEYKDSQHRLEQISNTANSLTHTIIIKITRDVTKYKQVNYVKKSYIMKNVIRTLYVNAYVVESAYKQLSSYNFELLRSEYNSQNQRKLMTKELRDKIKKRDHYTCQICGKYMPDGVGLQIDHIIPIAKGGKTIEENLQVLCSNCNLRKSDN